MIRFLKDINLRLKLLLVLIVLTFLYGFYIDFFEGPKPIHEWRKADCLSITYNYMKGEPFFEPKTNLILENGNRNAVSEFPIIYFLMGKLWSVIGQNEFLYRLLSFVLLLLGIILFATVVQYYLKSQKYTIIYSVFMFSSPILIGYAHNFIPNPISFALNLIAGFFVFQFLQNNKLYGLIGFFVFSTLAILIKITSILVFMSFIGAFIFYELFDNNYFWRKYKIKISLLSGSFILTLALVAAWYYYAIYYNTKYDSHLFSTTIRPIWEIPAEKRNEIFWHIINTMINYAYHRVIVFALIIFGVVALFSRSINAFLKWLIVMSIGALFSYLILWYWVFDVHDYYLIEILFVFNVLFFIFLYKINSFFSFLDLKKINLALYFFIIFVVLHAYTCSWVRFSANPKLIVNNIFLKKRDIDTWRWFNYDYGINLKTLQSKSDEIKKIIQPSDTILCLRDYSPNVHLYTLGRIGYSKFLYNGFSDREAIVDAYKRGARYVVFLGSEEERAKIPYSDYVAYQYERIYIFDLKPYKKIQ
ncbi:MAG: glycosyltransferase family 39 protein [Tenuifilum sp.]|uniref:hypothetical protein n=2 Tax=Tenuifilum sp. TaxID=2760880 RepID=UPI001B55D411|nr:glycosyltransferase family 39 protein [Bacteroidales bacterium]HOK61433.1 hypothetical protein [Tenuifilum sp.]MBP9028688.1 glycosyltransferase family 39 protein [Bacteroidales bacterium]HON70019.1 hypothetical protein [Tenuifilum sp.]HOU73983.1 hypothetical protein [Tenuifilum sp.]